ncbi:MAG TPA: hypothetical protein VFT74_05175, partial [Isosphaeraceae bacterium]|nr:hypothetical protein [Isosphaeraceae bacterium]
VDLTADVVYNTQPPTERVLEQSVVVHQNKPPVKLPNVTQANPVTRRPIQVIDTQIGSSRLLPGVHYSPIGSQVIVIA